MDCLPKELEDIIVDYKTQIETNEKYDKVVGQVNLLIKHYTSINFEIEVIDWYKFVSKNTPAVNFFMVISLTKLKQLDRKVRIKNNIQPFLKERNMRFWDMSNPRRYIY